ncbi:MAG: hypothetical protein EBV19_06820 [Flavobacteriia bacterium]|nr:hypothetical protein [Flavobacteriia bacterium]
MRKTTVKTRVLSGSQHLLRIDQEDISPLNKNLSEKLVSKVQAFIESGIDALIFEDYNKGVLTESVITECISLAKQNGVLTCVDPKKDHFFAFEAVDLFKPNLKELKEGLEIEINPKELSSLVSASSELRKKLHHRLSLITLSEFGVFVDDGQEQVVIPAHFRKITDVSGAGDTVISVAALALCSGMNHQQVAALANLAGTVKATRNGAYSFPLASFTFLAGMFWILIRSD